MNQMKILWKIFVDEFLHDYCHSIRVRIVQGQGLVEFQVNIYSTKCLIV